MVFTQGLLPNPGPDLSWDHSHPSLGFPELHPAVHSGGGWSDDGFLFPCSDFRFPRSPEPVPLDQFLPWNISILKVKPWIPWTGPIGSSWEHVFSLCSGSAISLGMLDDPMDTLKRTKDICDSTGLRTRGPSSATHWLLCPGTINQSNPQWRSISSGRLSATLASQFTRVISHIVHGRVHPSCPACVAESALDISSLFASI